MRKMINGKEYEIPKGFVLVGTPMIELIDKGDIALFRDGDQRPVEFVAALPDDLNEETPNIIAVKGYEPWTCTNDLKFDYHGVSDQDIVGILKSRGSDLLMGSGSETHYTVMSCDSDGKPKAFIDLEGHEYNDPDDECVYYYNVVEEAQHLRQRIADAKLRPFEDMVVVEVVKEFQVYPVAVEATESVPVTPAPCPVQVGSVLELVDGSVVDVLSVSTNTDPNDAYPVGITFKYGGDDLTLWYDRDGYTNHATALHIKRIKLF